MAVDLISTLLFVVGLQSPIFSVRPTINHLIIQPLNYLTIQPSNHKTIPPPPPMFVQPLAVGDTAKESIITEIVDREKAKIALILFFNPKRDEELYAYQLFYAEALQKRFKNNGLVCIGIANNDSLATRVFKEKYGFNLPFITDFDFALHRQYGIAAGYGGVFLQDSKGVICYADAESFSTSKIREIIEKNIGQELTKSSDDPFTPGKNMSDIKIVGEDGKLMTLSNFYGSQLVITLISPGVLRCGSCPASRRLDVLNRIADSLNAKTIAIIDYPAMPEQLTNLRQKFHLKFSAYSCLNLSQTTFDSITYPLTVVLNRTGKIIQTIPADKERDELLSALTNSLRGL